MNAHATEAQRISAESSLVNEWGLTERGIIATRAQAEATLALAYEQRTANLIAFLSAPDRDMDEATRALNLQIIERLGLPAFEPPNPEPIQHFRVGPARCNCGFDAYKISGIMIDYSEEFAIHLRANR